MPRKTAEPFHEVSLQTRRGRISLRLYEASGGRAGVVFVGGIGGGFDTPAVGLYPRLAEEFIRDGINSLRVQFRNAVDLVESVHDVIAGARFLAARRITRIALVGHSFGGAVVIQAAEKRADVVTVVALAPQLFGTQQVDRLAPRSLLLIHGAADAVLAPYCSEDIYRRATGAKELHILAGAGHMLDEAADTIHYLTRHWLLKHLLPE